MRARNSVPIALTSNNSPFTHGMLLWYTLQYDFLTIVRKSETAETECEEFLNELNPNTLQYFEVLSSSRLGPRSIKALGSHLSSLRELKLTSLSIEAIAELPSLAAPPVLEVLVLTDSIPTAQNDEFYSVITDRKSVV